MWNKVATTVVGEVVGSIAFCVFVLPYLIGLYLWMFSDSRPLPCDNGRNTDESSGVSCFIP